jgi:hypothetical protein
MQDTMDIRTDHMVHEPRVSENVIRQISYAYAMIYVGQMQHRKNVNI